MRKTKKLLKLLFIALVALGIMPTAVLAVDNSYPAYELGIGTITKLEEGGYYICNESIGTPTESNANEENYNLYFDSNLKTLTLKNATIPATLRVPGGTTIKVLGNNTINGSTGIQATTGGNVTIEGTGELSITSQSEGIVIPNNISGNIEIKDSVILNLKTANTAIINSNGNITIGGNAQIDTKPTNNNQSCIESINGNITVQDKAKIIAQNGGIHTSSGKILVTGSRDENEGINITINDVATAMKAGKDINFDGNITFNARSKENCIFSDNGVLTVGENADLCLNYTPNSSGRAIEIGKEAIIKGKVNIAPADNVAADYRENIGIMLQNDGKLTVDGGSLIITAGKGISTVSNKPGILEVKNKALLDITSIRGAISLDDPNDSKFFIDDSKLKINGSSGVYTGAEYEYIELEDMDYPSSTVFPNTTVKNSVIEMNIKERTLYQDQEMYGWLDCTFNNGPTYEYNGCYILKAGRNKDSAVKIKPTEQKEKMKYGGYFSVSPAEHNGTEISEDGWLICDNCGKPYAKAQKITLSYDEDCGSAEASSEYVKNGDSVTITVTRNPGYKVASVKAEATPLIENEDGKYILSNVTGNTTITVTFEKITVENVKEEINKLSNTDDSKEQDEDKVKPNILDIKQDYEELKEALKQGNENDNEEAEIDSATLNNALLGLKEIEVNVVKPNDFTDNSLGVVNKEMLLENMSSQEAKDLKSQDIEQYELKVTITDETNGAGGVENTTDKETDEGIIAAVYDITVEKTITQKETSNSNGNKTEKQKITELKAPLRIVFPIPKALQTPENGMTRTFKMLRKHGDKTTPLDDKDQNDDTYTIESDKFSKYTLTYTDTKSTDSSGSISYPSYRVLNFETNGGSSIDSITEFHGSTIELTLERYIPTREGYVFSGWYADKELTDKIDSVYLNGNKTIYAAWTKKDNDSEVIIEKQDQEISLVINKRYGDKMFNLGANANTNLSYKSDNTKVATVDDEGNVKITGVGTAKITISASENESYKATEKIVTIKVSKASQTIKINNNVKTIKRAAVAKKAKTYTFKTTGKKTALKAVKLTKAQKKAIKSVKISGNKVKVTVKKGAGKGTYKLKVYAAQNKNYKASAKKVITIRVK